MPVNEFWELGFESFEPGHGFGTLFAHVEFRVLSGFAGVKLGFELGVVSFYHIVELAAVAVVRIECHGCFVESFVWWMQGTVDSIAHRWGLFAESPSVGWPCHCV